jgi:hypothetical protein
MKPLRSVMPKPAVHKRPSPVRTYVAAPVPGDGPKEIELVDPSIFRAAKVFGGYRCFGMPDELAAPDVELPTAYPWMAADPEGGAR